MNRLLKAELFRRIFSFIFVGENICILIYNFLLVVGSNYGFKIDVSYFLFNKVSIICICIAVNVWIQLSQELDNRTINNKLFCGYDKSEFYLCELLVGIVEGYILLFTDTLSIFILAEIKKYDISIPHIQFMSDMIISLFIISTAVVISTVLTIRISHRIVSAFFVFAIVLFLIYSGNKTIQNLNQPRQTTLFSLDGELQDNPLYINGGRRTLNNAHLLFSPYAQACYTPYMLHEHPADKISHSLILKNAPYHWEFIIIDGVEFIVFYLLGFHMFQRRNLR